MDKSRYSIAVLCLLTAALSPLACAAPGDLYISATPLVLKVPLAGSPTGFSVGTLLPSGIAFDPAGNLFASDAITNHILRLTPDGTQTTFLGSGLNSPRGLAFDIGGNLYVADTGSGSILKIDVLGTVTTLLSSLLSPQFLALSPTVHQFYNISTRGYIQTGNRVLIAGLIIRGDPVGDLGSMSVLVRVLGPEL